jgi:hypothetical protein
VRKHREGRYEYVYGLSCFLVVRNGSEFEDEIERRWWVGLTKETQGLKSFPVSASFLERFQRASQYLDDLSIRLVTLYRARRAFSRFYEDDVRCII